MNSVGTTRFSSRMGGTSVDADPFVPFVSLPGMFSSDVGLSVILSLALVCAKDPGVSTMVGSAKR
jgi:hypothetical protein